MYAATSSGMLSAWDTRQNKCFIHWEGDSAEIGMLMGYGGTLIAGSASGNLRLWSVVGVSEMRLPGDATRLSSNGLVMEDEMTLDGAIISASFDEALETVHYGMSTGMKEPVSGWSVAMHRRLMTYSSVVQMTNTLQHVALMESYISGARITWNIFSFKFLDRIATVCPSVQYQLPLPLNLSQTRDRLSQLSTHSLNLMMRLLFTLHIVLLGTVMELSEYLIWVKWKWL